MTFKIIENGKFIKNYGFAGYIDNNNYKKSNKNKIIYDK